MIFEGESDGESEAFAEVAGEFDFAAVFANDASNDEQAEPASRGFGGEIRFEDFVHVVLENAAAGIGEADGEELGIGVGTDGKDPACLHGLEGIFDDVVESLFEMIAVDLDEGEIFAEDLFDEDIAVGDFGVEEGDGLAEEGVNIFEFFLGVSRADGAEELLDGGIEAGDFFEGDGEGFLEVVAGG